MIKRLLRLLFLPALFAWSGLSAQVNDAQMWFNAEIEKKITPAFSASFTEEVRLNENISEVGALFSDLGVSYKFLKRFKVGAFGRFTLKRRLDDTYQPFYSWYAELTAREKFKPVGLALRLRYQSKYSEEGTSPKAAIATNHIRAKLTVKYDLDMKLEPYVYAETYFRTCVPAYKSFDQLRLCAGVNYAFNRHHTVDLHYLFAREYNVVNPETDYVIGLGYALTF